MVADHQSSKHQGRINAWVNVRLGSEADIATGELNFCFTPESGQLVERVGMSALCQKRTLSGAAKRYLFDHLVGTHK